MPFGGSQVHIQHSSPRAPTVRLACEAVSPNSDSIYLGPKAIIPSREKNKTDAAMVTKTQLALCESFFMWEGKVLICSRSFFSSPYLLLYFLAISVFRASITKWLFGSRLGNIRKGIENKIDTVPPTKKQSHQAPTQPGSACTKGVLSHGST